MLGCWGVGVLGAAPLFMCLVVEALVVRCWGVK
nr:MAG TPA: hypothetical protein [Caudoviricetes sp.]